MCYLLGIDAGTTSFKGILIDEKGNTICIAKENYSLLKSGDNGGNNDYGNNNNIVEFRAEQYWEVFKKLINKILAYSEVRPEEIAGLAIDSQGETLICLDENGIPLRNAIVWMDNRSTEEASELREVFGIEKVYEITGQPELTSTWPATKMLWLSKHQKDVFKNTKKYLLLEDYLNYRLTGKYVTEKSLVSSSLYFDIHKGQWWEEILNYIGITVDQLPEIKESGQPIGVLTEEACRETGLSRNTIVVTGALDQLAGIIGAGNIYDNIVTESTGTCLAMCMNAGSPPVYNEKLKIPCHYHAISDKYCLLFWSQTAGIILEWFKDNFYFLDNSINSNSIRYNENNYIKKNEDSYSKQSGQNSYNSAKQNENKETKYGIYSHNNIYKIIDDEAAKVPPGSEGLILLPHLNGSATPHFNPFATGVFYGVTLNHTRAHFARAIMEAVGYMLKEHIETAESFETEVKEIRSIGGGAKSTLWNQIKADITGKEIITLENTETASLGAAILAGLGTGIFKDLESACKKCIKIKDRYYPDTSKTLIYQSSYEKYKELYNSVYPLFFSRGNTLCII
ncbi:MAG TPA: FGGY family carbohydrate kinase [Clostridiales bacterium]|nr:FGGY family carbohydrate kinase [Clostridiales bacterium]